MAVDSKALAAAPATPLRRPSRQSGVPFRHVFLSYSWDHDAEAARVFFFETLLRRSDVRVKNYSIKIEHPLPPDWRHGFKRLMDRWSVFICLIGHNTHQSEHVNWEIDCAAERKKQIVAVYVGDPTVRVPRALKRLGITPVEWDSTEMHDALDRALNVT